MTRLLILGGTTEARLLCDAVATLDCEATVSLAGVTRTPEPMAVPVRSGGFGGTQGITDWLVEHRSEVLIDATHPFASNMPQISFAACRALGIPRLRLLRAPFPLTAGMGQAANLTEAISRPPQNSRVLLTTGHRDLDALNARPDLTLFLRTIEPVIDLPANVTPLLMRPPFSLADEITLLMQHRIDVVIAKNSGGITAAKLTAAEQLKRDVILLARPHQPPGPTVQTVKQAVAWLRHVVGLGS